MDIITNDLLDRKRLQTDPQADEIIQRIVHENGTREAKRIFNMLIREIELPLDKLPKTIHSFVQNNSNLPEWANLSKINKAQDLFIDHGPKFLLFLYFKSLPLLYSMKNGVQVLVKTGRLAHNPDSELIFTRRIAETGQFLLEVMAPDGFENNRPAIEAALKIRLIHASIRHFISFGEWNESVWGKPINQEDLAATLMTFGVTMTESLKQFGIPVLQEEEEAYVHYWNIIGHFMGIDNDLLPENSSQAVWLLNKILQRQSAFSDEGALMTEALLSFITDKTESGIIQSSPKVMIRFLIGNEQAKNIGINRPKWWWFYRLIPAFLKIWFRIGESLEDRVESLERFADRVSNELVKSMVGYFDTYKQRKFKVPESLDHKWMINSGT